MHSKALQLPLRYRPLRLFLWIMGAIAGIIACIWLFPSPGTGDVGLYEQIIAGFRRHGLAHFYTCITDNCPGHWANYPPLYLLVFYLTQQIGGTIFTTFILEKSVVAIFYAATILLLGYFALIFRPKNITTIDWVLRGIFLSLTGISFIINSISLGYIDSFVYPFIILSLILLSRHKYFLSGIFFACGFLMKWIPILMLPLYILHTHRLGKKSLILFVMGVAVPVYITGVFAWGWNFLPVYIHGLLNAGSDPYFVAAPTIPWLWTMVFPLLIKGLPDNLLIHLNTLTTTPTISFVYFEFKLIFLCYYFWILYQLYKFSPTEQTMRPLLWGAVYIYIGYFFLATGVHENHLMMGVLCALLLTIMHPTTRTLHLYREIDFISAGSMMLYYGISGTPLIPVNTTTIAYPFVVTLIFSYWFIRQASRIQNDLAG